MDGYATLVRFSEAELGIPLSEALQTFYMTRPLDSEVVDRASDPNATITMTSPPGAETSTSPAQPGTPSAEMISDDVSSMLGSAEVAPISHPSNDSTINDSTMEDVDAKDPSSLNVKRRRIQPFLVRPL
jgi:hypothetical protein